MFVEISILVLMIAGSMFFSGMETAMFGVGPLNLVQGNQKKLYWLYSRKDKIVMTCLIGNNITIVGATIMINHLVLSSGNLWATILTLSLEIIIIFLLAEVLPKTVAHKVGIKILEALYYPIRFFFYAFLPLSQIFSSFMGYFSKFLSSSAKIKREDIFNFLSVQMSGQDITKSLMDLKSTTAKEIMTPLNKIYSLDRDAHVEDAVKLLDKTSYSRYPVYEDRGDQITEFLSVSKLLKANKKDKISNYTEKASYIPELLPVDQLLSKMQTETIPMVFVVSELGSVIGLVTLEDIAEELVGDIYSQEQPGLEMIVQESKDKNLFTLSGVLDIDDFNEYFKLNIKKSGFETLSGFLMKEEMSIPKVNQELYFDFGSLKVLEADTRSVKKLCFRKKKKTNR